MTFVTIEEAHARLPDLIAGQPPGETIYITRGDDVIAELLVQPAESDEPPELGSMPGSVLYMAPDFDASLEGHE